jgi:hypothetical protein
MTFYCFETQFVDQFVVTTGFLPQPMMMNFYCSDKHVKTNRFDSDWGQYETNRTQQGHNHRTSTNHGEGHADHEEAQAGVQALQGQTTEQH